MELGELIDEHFEFAFRTHHTVKIIIAIGALVPPSSEVPRGRAHAGYGRIARISNFPRR